MKKNNELSSNANLITTVYTEVSIGILANIVLLLFHVFLFFLRHRHKPTDLPIGLLALIHLIMLFITGFIATDTFTPQRGRWGDMTCKFVIYMYRLMRGFSICTTCLLSIVQTIILCPRSSCLAKFKHKSSLHNLCYLLFLWTFYTSFTSHILDSVISTSNFTSDNLLRITESCSLVPMSYFLWHTFSTVLTFREVFTVGLMALSNGYMVTLLCRHKRRSQRLHSTSLSPKKSPEQRASRIIVLLTSCFLLMSILDSFISYARLIVTDDPVFYCIQILVVHIYATVSPVVFISTEDRITHFLRSMCRRTINILLIGNR